MNTAAKCICRYRLARGPAADFDSGGVFTPNILEARGRYYLFYTAIRNPISVHEPTAIGEAVAASPDGPWKKLASHPVLIPGRDAKEFDSFRVDDACLITRAGKYWLYYKGRQQGHTPQETKWGVAIAAEPTGPYRKSAANPVVRSGHEVLVWPDGGGVAALVGPTGPEKNTIQFAADGLHFRVISHIASPPGAPGAYRPDAFTNTRHAAGIQWGISMRGGPNPYLVRWEYVQHKGKTR
ncbi:MAG: family 43 glycosylhydrolase [Terriglobia bacterium]